MDMTHPAYARITREGIPVQPAGADKLLDNKGAVQRLARPVETV